MYNVKFYLLLSKFQFKDNENCSLSYRNYEIPTKSKLVLLVDGPSITQITHQ